MEAKTEGAVITVCGICGQFDFQNRTPVDAGDIRLMMSTIAHRGPDDEGCYVSGSLGLGFRRLSIIDLSGGHQPMTNADRSVWVVFNGEIYNFKELQRELEGYGHVFQTRSDTEVIVHGYSQWGKEVLQHLNGMFGLAIWDERARQLMVARDRMGIKLIYYALSGGRLTFASEMRPLLACAKEKPQIDPYAVSLFLRYRYTPSPLTVLQGIKKLAPGTRLIVGESQPPLIERWWNYKPEPFDPMPSDREMEEKLLELYQRAVKRQLIADVPLGLLLSGGLDSGLLLALMNQHGQSHSTFTVGYGKNFAEDELTTAARTAQLLHAPNSSVEISRDTFEATLPEILKTLEEPIAASSIVPMYHVCKRARQDVKVAFMGQGPDELFGGYTRHLGVHYGGYWRGLPPWLRNNVTSALNGRSGREWMRRGLYALGTADRLQRYQRVLSIVPGEEIRKLFRSTVLPEMMSEQMPEQWQEMEPLISSLDELGGLQFLEVRSTLPDELLMYADKLSMAHGLEVRVPFLDQEIVEYVERLSATSKVRYGTRKWLHRSVCKQLLPQELIGRKKRGFAVNVVDSWFRSSSKSKLCDVLLDPQSHMYSYLEPSTVSGMFEEHKQGSADHHKLLFSLVALEYSLRNYGL